MMCNATALRVFMTFSSGGASAVVEESRKRQGKVSWTTPKDSPLRGSKVGENQPFDAFLHYKDASGAAPRNKRGQLYTMRQLRRDASLRERFTPAPSGDLTGTPFAAIVNGGSVIDLEGFSDQPGGLLV